MTDADAAQNKAAEAANQIATHMGRLWMEAHTDGLRNGMECGALLLEQAATNARQAQFPDLGVGEWVVGLLEGLRDQMRLLALQVPEPEMPA